MSEKDDEDGESSAPFAFFAWYIILGFVFWSGFHGAYPKNKYPLGQQAMMVAMWPVATVLSAGWAMGKELAREDSK